MLLQRFPSSAVLTGFLVFALPLGVRAESHGLEDALDAARVLHREGHLEEALSAYREVAARAGSDEPELAATARNNACVVLMNRGRYREAVGECESALELRRGLDDEIRLARTLNNLGLALQHQGRLDEARDHFLQARDLNRGLGETRGEVVNEANLGVLNTLTGRYDRALAHHETAANLAREHPDVAWREHQIRTALINRGVVLEKLGAYREALDLYRRVLEDEEDLEAWLLAPLLVNKGVIYRNLGDPVQALDDFARARALFDSIGDLAGLSNTWLNEALALHLNLERPAEAEKAYRLALVLAREGGDVSEEIQDYFYLGSLLRETGRLEEAAEVFTLCLEASRAADSAEGRWSSLEGLGRVAWAQDRTGVALGLLLQALDEIERARVAVAGGRLRSEFFGNRRSAYAATAQLLAEMHQTDSAEGHAETAFFVSQRAKARDLLDALGDNGSPLAPLTTIEVRQNLGDSVLLEYFIADSNILRWELHKEGLELAVLGQRHRIVGSVVELHGALSRGEAPRPDLTSELSVWLLSGLSPHGLSATSLHVAGDGSLRYLPFELLYDPSGENRQVLDWAVLSYLPSGSALARPRALREGRGTFLSGLANPDLGIGSTNGPSPAAATAFRHGLGALPGAELEIRAAASTLPDPPKILVGVDASEEAFRRLALESPAVLHLATHAVLDERSDHGATVLLRATGDDDGLLFPAEIAALTIRSRLIVLSACRSALGGPQDGRALASLTGAFLAAGSDAVLATLWEVGDETAAVFGEQFYYEIAMGRPPDEALRSVKRRMRGEPDWSHPSVWAAWVLVGDGSEPLVRRPYFGPATLGLVILGAAIAFVAFNRLRRRADSSRA